MVLTREFRALWEAANQSYLSWEGLDNFVLPAGATKEAVWKLITALRRHGGFTLPFRPYVPTSDGISAWIAPPHDMERALALLKTQGSSQTTEHRTLSALPLSRKAALMIDEFAAALAIDGYGPEGRASLNAYLTRSAPRNPADAALFQLIDAFFSVEPLGPGPITPADLDRINGIFETPPGSGQQGPVLAAIERNREQYLNLDYYTPQNTKGTICDILNDPALNPIVAELQARYFLISLTPYAAGNAATALLLRRAFLEKHHLGLLACASTLAAIVAWQQGSYGLGLPDYDGALAPRDCGEGFDATEFTHYNLLVFANELRQLRQRIAGTERSLARVRERIAGAAFLNGRQKAIVAAMAENPFHATTIEEVSAEHEVSYSSARTDLMGLVRQGYARCERPDCANEPHVFCAGPRTLALFRSTAGEEGRP